MDDPDNVTCNEDIRIAIINMFKVYRDIEELVKRWEKKTIKKNQWKW